MLKSDYKNCSSVDLYRKTNLFYKREFLECIYNAWQDDKVDLFLEQIHKKDYPFHLKQELIVDTFLFSQIITLVDFINPIKITPRMAKSFYFYKLLYENIKYSDNPEEKLFLNFKKIDPKSFDWEVPELNNYQFIISL